MLNKQSNKTADVCSKSSFHQEENSQEVTATHWNWIQSFIKLQNKSINTFFSKMQDAFLAIYLSFS